MAKTRETLDSIRMEARLVSDEKLKELFIVYSCLWWGDTTNANLKALDQASVYRDEMIRRNLTNVLLK